jgi:hypothetical protein
MIGKFAAIAAISALMAGQAVAAEASLAQVKGNVLVSQGGKMVNASGVSSLRAGDRVVASNGAAKISYADGCVVSLNANGMATIGAASPCANGAGLVSASQGSSAQLFEGSNGMYAAIGGFLIATAIVVGVAESGDDEIVSP